MRDIQSPFFWYGTEAAAATCALTGTITDDTEADIVAGGSTIILTLTNDTWVATVGGDNAITEALIAGLDSDGAEAGGWDAKVKAVMDYNEVVRTSPTVVTITLDAYADYDITATETITATIPATALTAAGEVTASPTFDITSVAGAVISNIVGSGGLAGRGSLIVGPGGLAG